MRIVDSMARPGGNVTGLSSMSFDVNAKAAAAVEGNRAGSVASGDFPSGANKRPHRVWFADVARRSDISSRTLSIGTAG
jgi:hypothetical protein